MRGGKWDILGNELGSDVVGLKKNRQCAGFRLMSLHADFVLFSAGPRSAFGSAVGCGILLGVFEGELSQSTSLFDV